MSEIEFMNACGPIGSDEEKNKLCTIDGDFIIFPTGRGCEIPLSKCSTAAKLFGWILYLAPNTWVTTAIIERFIHLVTQHHGIRIEYP